MDGWERIGALIDSFTEKAAAQFEQIHAAIEERKNGLREERDSLKGELKKALKEAAE